MRTEPHIIFHHSNAVLNVFICTLASWSLVKAVTKYIFTCKLYYTKVNMSFLMNYEGLSGLTGDNVHYNFKLQQNLTDGAAAVAFQGLKC